MRNNFDPQSTEFHAAIAGKTEHVDYELIRYADGSVDLLTGDDMPQNPVPKTVSPRQIRLALNQLGLRATVEQAVASGSQDLRDWWEYALDIERDNALVVGMAQQLGITEQQIDDLFRLSATL